ncbi:unnamed protein product, partial [Discosporangium mesarthrocarpum]
EAFSSVAAAFDFQHHVGTDTARELTVLKRILARECILSRLKNICNGLSISAVEGTACILDLLIGLRDATVGVVESVRAWRGSSKEGNYMAFMWHGKNYLLKMVNDLNFLAGCDPLVVALKIHPACLCRNPLMLPQTLDE